MTIEMTCKQCGRPFQPSKADLMRGPQHYRYCSEFCRLAARKRPDELHARRVANDR